jgi:hypothetical protein
MADVTGVYSDARSEYTKQLCNILIPSYFQFFLNILDKAKAEVTKMNEPKKLLWQFQTFLNDIPDWNMEKVNTEIATLQASCGCDYMEDLLTAVFIAHTKVLTAIRVSAKQKRVQITVPKVEHFMFKVLCETSKVLWGNSFLFREGIMSMEKQQNYRTVEGLLAEGIHQAIRAMVPVKNILKDFVTMDGDEEGEEDVQGSKEEVKEEANKEQTEEVVEEQKVEVKEEQKEEVKEEANKEQTEEGPVDGKVEPILAPIEISDLLVPESSNSTNEIVQPADETPIIRIQTDSGPRVGFTQMDTLFDNEIDGNDIIEESGYEEDEGGLEILDGDAEPLDFADLDTLNGGTVLDALDVKDEPIEMGDYDVLV